MTTRRILPNAFDEAARTRDSSGMSRVLTLAALLLMSCGATEVPPQELVATLQAPGPYAVGFRSMPVSYTTPITGESRTTEVLVWYPAQATTGDHPLYLLRASTVAVIDAPPLDLGPQPTVVFSHGHQAYASVMSDLMEHFASHGYLAIAPMHTGNTFVDGDDRKTEIYYLRALDVRAALDTFGNGGPAIIMGHSFGGYTAYASVGARYDIDTLAAACSAGTGPTSFCSTFDAAKSELFRAGLTDARYRGLLAVDSGDFSLFGSAGVSAVTVPVLHMVAEESVSPPGGDPYWSALTAPARTRVLLRGGAHNDFTDSCGAGAEIRCSTLPPAQVLSMVRVYALAFTRSVLEADASVDAVLSGEVEVSTLVELTAP